VKVMISFPPLEGKGYPQLGQNRQFQWFHNPTIMYPIVPASAATLLNANGYDVLWTDCIAEGLSWSEFADFFENEKPQIVAMETKTPVIKHHWKIIAALKNLSPLTVFVLMGDHVTALPQESLKKSPVDYIITGGDYDVSLLGIAEHIRAGSALPKGIWYRNGENIYNTGKFELNYNLDLLPMVDRELTKWRIYKEEAIYKRKPFARTMVGRDCLFNCTFCSWKTIYPNFRTRSSEKLLDEIKMLIDKYGVREIFDDTGTFPSSGWLKRFCAGMIERGYNKEVILDCNFRFDLLSKERARMMKKAGFRCMKIGLESANQATLDELNKHLKVEQITQGCQIAKDAGLEVHLTCMVGYPWETKEDAQRTLKLAEGLMEKGLAQTLQATLVIPYPGTPLHREAVEQGWLRFDPKAYERYDMSEPVFKTPDMEPEEVMQICDEIYKSFLKPKFLLHHLRNISSFEDAKYLARGIKPLLGHLRDFSRSKVGIRN